MPASGLLRVYLGMALPLMLQCSIRGYEASADPSVGWILLDSAALPLEFSSASNLPLVLRYGNQLSWSSDTYTYALVPVIESVHGCLIDMGNSTSGCSTGQPTNIIITGHNLFNPITVH